MLSHLGRQEARLSLNATLTCHAVFVLLFAKRSGNAANVGCKGSFSERSYTVTARKLLRWSGVYSENIAKTLSKVIASSPILRADDMRIEMLRAGRN